MKACSLWHCAGSAGVRLFVESRKGTNERSVCLDVKKSSDVFPVEKRKQDRVNAKNSKNN
ncbi:hypothetical protein SDC9_79136 [bioreactor metagenome]|uniref:Uncharacterized protein n=1 Tax=bioreactor metagenome TaxID=1076179 RepID=A0A644YVS1_9ZZZZ